MERKLLNEQSKLINIIKYPKVQAPPATTFLHPRHSQIPTAVRRTASRPQKLQVYLAC